MSLPSRLAGVGAQGVGVEAADPDGVAVFASHAGEQVFHQRKRSQLAGLIQATQRRRCRANNSLSRLTRSPTPADPARRSPARLRGRTPCGCGRRTAPARRISIFIDSTMTSGSPCFTAAPSSTSTFHTLPATWLAMARPFSGRSSSLSGAASATRQVAGVVGLAARAPAFALGVERGLLLRLEGGDGRGVVGEKRVVVAQAEGGFLDLQLIAAEREVLADLQQFSASLTGKKRTWSKKRSSHGLPSVKSAVCRQRFHICRVRPTNW